MLDGGCNKDKDIHMYICMGKGRIEIVGKEKWIFSAKDKMEKKKRQSFNNTESIKMYAKIKTKSKLCFVLRHKMGEIWGCEGRQDRKRTGRTAFSKELTAKKGGCSC